jgi:hypothetical protein
MELPVDMYDQYLRFSSVSKTMSSLHKRLHINQSNQTPTLETAVLR